MLLTQLSVAIAMKISSNCLIKLKKGFLFKIEKFAFFFET